MDTLHFNSAGRPKTAAVRWFERICAVLLFLLGIAGKMMLFVAAYGQMMRGHPWLALLFVVAGLLFSVRVTYEDD